MAYVNFKPLVWSKFIQTQLPKFTVFENDCDYQFQGEVGKGKQVKILGVGRPSLGDYDGTDIGTPETVADSSIYLTIDKARYFNFMVDDVDKAQSVDGLMPALMSEANKAMAQDRDTYIAELCATGGAKNVSSSTDISSAATTKAAIDLGLVTLWDEGVRITDDVTMYLSPLAYQYMQEYIVGVKTNNDALVASGILGTYSGAKIKMTNNLYNDGTDDYVVIKTSKAVAFASGIDSVEAYRPEGLFSDAVKGLNTYGGKIVRPEQIYIAKLH